MLTIEKLREYGANVEEGLGRCMNNETFYLRLVNMAAGDGGFAKLREALETAIHDSEIGIILLTEKFGREFPDLIDDVRLHHRTPLIIEIPDRHGTGRKKDFITSYVNEAIGLKL